MVALGILIASALSAQTGPAEAATRVGLLVEKLAAETGQDLRCAPNVAGEVALIYRDGKPASEVMKALAIALDGEWERVGETRYLRRHPNFVRNETRREQEQKRAYWAAVIEQYKAELAIPLDAETIQTFLQRPRTGSERWTIEQVHSYQRALSPLHRLVGGLLVDAGVEKLAAAPPTGLLGEEVRYGVSIGPTFRDRVRRALQESTLLGPYEDVPRLDGSWNTLRGDISELMEPGNLIIRYREPNQTENSVGIYARAKSSMYSGGIVLPNLWPSHESDSLEIPLLEFDYTDRSLAYRQANLFGMAYSSRTPKEYFEPETVDPLAYGVSEAAIRLAKAKGKPAVFVLPDSVFQNQPAERTVELSHFAWNEHMRFSENEGWLVGKPMWPLRASKERLDRRALGSFLRAHREHFTFPYQEYASIIQALDTSEEPRLLRDFVTSIGRIFVPEFAAVRLYESLDGAMKTALLSGQTRPFNVLSPQSQQMWLEQAFSRFAWKSSDENPTKFLHRPLPPELLAVTGIDGLVLKGSTAKEQGVVSFSQVENSPMPMDYSRTVTQAQPDDGDVAGFLMRSLTEHSASAYLPVVRHLMKVSLETPLAKLEFEVWAETREPESKLLRFEELPPQLKAPPRARDDGDGGS